MKKEEEQLRRCGVPLQHVLCGTAVDSRTWLNSAGVDCNVKKIITVVHDVNIASF
jgi:hypothetical protein